MAEAREELILEINVSDAATSIANLTGEVDALKKSQDLLNASLKAGEITLEDYNKAMAQNGSAVRNTNAELRAQQRVLDGHLASKKKEVDVTNFANNSINQNRNLLKQLTAQYNELKNPSAQATAKINDLTKVLKTQEAAIGDTRRNVGNYKDSILDAVGSLRFMGTNIGGIIDPLKNMGLGFQAAGGGVRGFSAALATTGLPIIITGINLLVEAFSTFKPLVEGVEDALAGFGAALGITYSNGVALNKLKREIEDAEISAVVRTATASKNISILEATANNKAARAEDRIKSLQEANRLIEEENDKQLKDAQLKLKKATQEELKSLEDQNKKRRAILAAPFGALLTDFNKPLQATDEARKAAAEAQADIIRIEERNFTRRIDNQNRIEKLQKDILEDNQNRVDETAKQAALEAQIDDELTKKKLDNARKLDEANKKRREEEAKLFESETNRLLDAEVRRSQITAGRIGTVEAAIDAEIIARQRLLQNESLNAIERENIIRESEDRISKMRKDAYDKDVVEQQKASDKKIQAQQAELQASSSISNSLIGLIGNVAQAAGAGAEFQKALAFGQILVQQALAIAAVVAGGANSGLGTGPAAIVTTPTFIATLVGAVVAVIGGALNMLNTPTPTPPKFAEGGGIDIDGNPHGQGGTPIHVNGRLVAVAERDEKMFILKKDASEKIGLLSKWNEFWGGRSWTGSPVSHAAEGGLIDMTDGGFASRDLGRNIEDRFFMQEAIKNGFRLAPKPVLSIVELENKQNDRNRSINISEA